MKRAGGRNEVASMSYLPAQCLVSSRLNRFHGPPLLSVLSTSLPIPFHYPPPVVRPSASLRDHG